MQRLSHNRVVGFIILVVSLIYLYYSQHIQLDFWSEDEIFNARSMPQLFGGFTLICSILLILAPSSPSKPSEPHPWRELRELNWRPTISILLMISGYGLALPYLGFLISNSLFLMLAFTLLGQRNWLVMAAFAIGLTVGFYLLMDLLGIYLDPGEWVAPLLSLSESVPNQFRIYAYA